MIDITQERFSDLTQLTQAAIKHETETLAGLGMLGKVNMTDAIRNNLGVWEATLFPLLRSRRIGKYQYVAELLVQAGYKDVTAKHVCTVIHRIRHAKKSNVKDI